MPPVRAHRQPAALNFDLGARGPIKQLPQEKELFRDYDSALCRAATEASSRESLKEKVNLVARIVTVRGWKTRHAQSIVRRLVEVSEDPMAIKENLLFVTDSIMRHAAREDHSIASAYEKAFEPNLMRLFKAALHRRETKDSVGEYLLRKIVPTWKDNCWFPSKLPLLTKLLTHKVSKLGEEEPKVMPSPEQMSPAVAELPSEEVAYVPSEPAYDPFADRSPYSPSMFEDVKEPYVKDGATPRPLQVVKPEGMLSPAGPPPTEPGDEDIRFSQESEEGEFVPTLSGDPYTQTLDTAELEKLMPPMFEVRAGEGEGLEIVSPYIAPGLAPYSPTEVADGSDLMDLVPTLPTERATFSSEPTVVPSSQAGSQAQRRLPPPPQAPRLGLPGVPGSPSSPTELPAPTSPGLTEAGLDLGAELDLGLGLAPLGQVPSPTVLPEPTSPTEVPAPTEAGDQEDDRMRLLEPASPVDGPEPLEERAPTTPAESYEDLLDLGGGAAARPASSPTEIPAPTSPVSEAAAALPSLAMPSSGSLRPPTTVASSAASRLPPGVAHEPLLPPSSPTEVPVPTEAGDELHLGGDLGLPPPGAARPAGAARLAELELPVPTTPASDGGLASAVAHLPEDEEEVGVRLPTSPAPTDGLGDLDLGLGVAEIGQVGSPTELPVPTQPPPASPQEVPAPTSPAPSAGPSAPELLDALRGVLPRMAPHMAERQEVSSPTEVPAPTSPAPSSPRSPGGGDVAAVPPPRPGQGLLAAPAAPPLDPSSPTEMPVPTQVPSPTSLAPDDMDVRDLPVPGVDGARGELASPTHIPSPTSPGDDGEEPDGLGGPPPGPGGMPLGRIDLRYAESVELGQSSAMPLAPSSPTEVPVPTEQAPSPTSPIAEDEADVPVMAAVRPVSATRSPTRDGAAPSEVPTHLTQPRPTETRSLPTASAGTRMSAPTLVPTRTQTVAPTLRTEEPLATGDVPTILPTIIPSGTEPEEAPPLPPPSAEFASAELMSAPPPDSPTEMPVPTEQPSPTSVGAAEEQELPPPVALPGVPPPQVAVRGAPSSPTEMPVPTQAPSPTSVGAMDADIIDESGQDLIAPSAEFGPGPLRSGAAAPSSPTEMPVPTEAPSPTEVPDEDIMPAPSAELPSAGYESVVRPRAAAPSSPTEMPVPTEAPSPTSVAAVDDGVAPAAGFPAPSAEFLQGRRPGAGAPSSPTEMPVPTAAPSPTSVGAVDEDVMPALSAEFASAEYESVVRPRAPSSPTEMPVPTEAPSPTSAGALDEGLPVDFPAPSADFVEPGVVLESSPTEMPVPTAAPSPTEMPEEMGAAAKVPLPAAGAASEAAEQGPVSSPTEMPVPTDVPSPTEAAMALDEIAVPTIIPSHTTQPTRTVPSRADTRTVASGTGRTRTAGDRTVVPGAPSSPTEMPVPTAVPSPTSPIPEVEPPLSLPTVVPSSSQPTVSVSVPSGVGVPPPRSVPSAEAEMPVPSAEMLDFSTQLADVSSAQVGEVPPSSPTEMPVPTAVPSPTEMPDGEDELHVQVRVPDTELVDPGSRIYVPGSSGYGGSERVDAPSSPTEMPVPTALPSPTSPILDAEGRGQAEMALGMATEEVMSALPPSSPTEMPVPTAVPSPTSPIPEVDPPMDPLEVQPPVGPTVTLREYIPGSTEYAAQDSPTEMPVPTERPELSPVEGPGDGFDDAPMEVVPAQAALGGAAAPSSPTEMPVPTDLPSPGALGEEASVLPMEMEVASAGAPEELLESAEPAESPTEMPVPTAVPSPTSLGPPDEDGAGRAARVEPLELPHGPGASDGEDEALRSAPPSSPTEMPVPTAVLSPTSPAFADGEEFVAPTALETAAARPPRETAEEVLEVLPTAGPGSVFDQSAEVMSAPVPTSPTEMPVPTAVPSPTAPSSPGAEAESAAPPPEETELVPTAAASAFMVPLPATEAAEVVPTAFGGRWLGKTGEELASAPVPSSPSEMPVPTAVPSPTSPARAEDAGGAEPAVAVPRRPAGEVEELHVSSAIPPSSPTEMPVPTDRPSPTSFAPEDEAVAIPPTELQARAPGADDEVESVPPSAEFQSAEMASAPAAPSPTEMPVPTAVPSPDRVDDEGPDDDDSELSMPQLVEPKKKKGRAAPSSPTEMPVPTRVLSPTSPVMPGEAQEPGMLPMAPPAPRDAVPATEVATAGPEPSPSSMPVPTDVPSPAEGAEAADAFELPPPAKLVSASPVEASAPGLSSPTDMPVPTAVPSPTPMAAEDEGGVPVPPTVLATPVRPRRRARDGVSPQATDVPTISPAITGSLSPHAATPSSAPTVVPGPRTEPEPTHTRTDAPTLSEMPTRTAGSELTRSVPTRSDMRTRIGGASKRTRVSEPTAPTDTPASSVPTVAPLSHRVRPGAAPTSPTEIAVPTRVPSPTSPAQAGDAAEIPMSAPPLPPTALAEQEDPAEIPMPTVPEPTALAAPETQPVPVDMASADMAAASAPPPSSPTEMPVPTAVPSPTSMMGDDGEDAAVAPTATLLATAALGTAALGTAGTIPSAESAAFGSAEWAASAPPASPTEMPVPTDVPSPTSPALQEGRDMVEVPTAMPTTTSGMPTVTMPTDKSGATARTRRRRAEAEAAIVVGGPSAQPARHSPTELPVPTDMPSPTSLPLEAPEPLPAPSAAAGRADTASAPPEDAQAAEELPLHRVLSPTSPAMEGEQEDDVRMQVPAFLQQGAAPQPAEEREEVEQMAPLAVAGGSAEYAAALESAETMGSAPAPSSPTEMPVPTDIPSPTSPAPLDDGVPADVALQVPEARTAGQPAAQAEEGDEAVAVPAVPGPEALSESAPPMSAEMMSAAHSSPTEMPVPTDIPSPTSLAPDDAEETAVPLATAPDRRQRGRPQPGSPTPVELAVPAALPSPTSPAVAGGAAEEEALAMPAPKKPVPRRAADGQPPDSPTELPVPTDLPSPTSPTKAAAAAAQQEDALMPAPRRPGKRQFAPPTLDAGDEPSSPTFLPAQFDPTSPAEENLADDQQLEGPPVPTASLPTLEPTSRVGDDEVPVPTQVPTIPSEPSVPPPGLPTSPALPVAQPVEYPSPLMVEPETVPRPGRPRRPAPKRQRVAPQPPSAEHVSPATPLRAGPGAPRAGAGALARRRWGGPPTPTGRGTPLTPLGGVVPGTPSYSPTEDVLAPGTPIEGTQPGRTSSALAGRTSSVIEGGSSPTYVAEDRPGQPLPPTPTYTASSPTYVDDNEPPTPTLEPDDDDLYGDDVSVATGTTLATGVSRITRRGGAGLLSPMMSQPLTPLSIIQGGAAPGTPIDLLQGADQHGGAPGVAAAGTPTALRLPGMEDPTPTYEPDDSAAYEEAGQASGDGEVAAAAATPGTPPGQLPGAPQPGQPGTPTGAAPAASSAGPGVPPLASEVFPGQAGRRRTRGTASSEEELPPWKRRAKRRGQG